jgi:hypothetical protein
MRTTMGALLTAVVVLALGMGTPQPVKAAGVPGPTTLWNFLGIPQGINKVFDATVNRHGKHPGLERKDALKRIADPANLESEVPAIKAAAEIKADADLAKQKVKAIRYLSDVGCGCSSQKANVQEALLAALDDCTEEVRYEAALAFCRTSGNPCSACGASCCGEDVTAKLKDMAFGQDDEGCYHESSSRVRAAAMNALNACEMIAGPTPVPPEQIRERPVEQPTTAPRTDPVKQTRVHDPRIESELRIPLSPIMSVPGSVKPAGFVWAGRTQTAMPKSGLQQPKSAVRSVPETRFRGAVVAPVK